MTTDELVKQMARQLDRIEYDVQQIAQAMLEVLQQIQQLSDQKELPHD